MQIVFVIAYKQCFQYISGYDRTDLLIYSSDLTLIDFLIGLYKKIKFFKFFETMKLDKMRRRIIIAVTFNQISDHPRAN
jgi:hypothetical protein